MDGAASAPLNFPNLELTLDKSFPMTHADTGIPVSRIPRGSHDRGYRMLVDGKTWPQTYDP